MAFYWSDAESSFLSIQPKRGLSWTPRGLRKIPRAFRYLIGVSDWKCCRCYLVVVYLVSPAVGQFPGILRAGDCRSRFRVCPCGAPRFSSG